MIVYHGSSIVVEEPDNKHSVRALDFGPGFYVTTIRKQAERWALRKTMRALAKRGVNVEDLKAIVNCYDLSEDCFEPPYRSLRFTSADKEWLDFVTGCRRRTLSNESWDVIAGGIADDSVYEAISFYADGLWDAERTLKEIKFYGANDQICLVSQTVINQKLCFIRSYEVTRDD